MPNARAVAHDSDGQMHDRWLDPVVADLARRQHGVVGRAQLDEIGLGRGAIDLRVARRRLHVLYRGVYAVGHLVLTDEGRWMAAVLAGGRRAVLSHRSAAALWGIRPSGLNAEVTTARMRRSRPGLRFHRSELPDDEVTVHGGIPATTVPRTLFDLAGVIPRRQLERAVNEAEVRRLWDALSLADLLRRHPRRPGAAAIRAVIAAPGGTMMRSELEGLFLELVEAEELPRPAVNLPLQLSGRWIEADCAWRDQRLIVELDGHATHHTREAYESDRARDRVLTAAGWRVIRITWRQLHADRKALAKDLRAALARGPAANLPRA